MVGWGSGKVGKRDGGRVEAGRTVGKVGSEQVTQPSGQRDHFIDFVRAASLVVVVVWHWAFTVLKWEADGPHATNPIGFTKGMWVVTWVAQVMPLFFFVGGCANLKAYERAAAKGIGVWKFVGARLKELLGPAFILIGVWWGILIGVSAVVDLSWLRTTVVLILSPLWFAFSYAFVIAVFPVFLMLHRRFSFLVPIWLAGLAALVDIARFAHDVSYIGWVNMIVVWGLAHQLGFFYDSLKAASRRVHQAMAWSGLFFLLALVWSRIYPGSMVGVPGDKFSNMAPPSLAIVALVVLQTGLLLLIREWVEARLPTPKWARFVRLMRTYAMPLYLLHTSGLAVFLIAGYFINHRAPLSTEISWRWWAWRPLAVLLPLTTTVPLLLLIGRVVGASKKAAKKASAAVSEAARTIAERID